MELEDILDDYDDLSNDLLSSNYQIFDSRLTLFFGFIDETPVVRDIMKAKLPELDFENWYENAATTVKGMVGSGTLDWPTNRMENLSMRFALLRYMKEGKVDVPNFCMKFMYSDNNFDLMLNEFSDQIIRPTLRDIRKVIERSFKNGEVGFNATSTFQASATIEPGPALIAQNPSMVDAFEGARKVLADVLTTMEGQNDRDELELTDEELKVTIGHLRACSAMLKDHMLSRGLLNDTVDQVSPLKDKLGLFAAVTNAFSAIVKFFV